MPIAAKAIAGAIYGQFGAHKYTGKNAIDLSDAVGAAIAQYVKTPNLVTCSLTGLAGPNGQITSMFVLGLNPTTMSKGMMAVASSKKLLGRDMQGILDSISLGLFQTLMGMFLTGTAVGIATGAGTGSFLAANGPALSGILYGAMSKKKLIGKNYMDISDAISFGFATHLKSAVTFSVMCAGVVAPTPPTGPVAVAAIPSLTTSIA